MSSFYLHTSPKHPDKSAWLYSERGLLSHLVHHALFEDPLRYLADAKDGNRRRLLDALGFSPRQFIFFSEFDLGNNGFGKPDGAIFVKGDTDSAFVWIEAKATPFFYVDPTYLWNMYQVGRANNTSIHDLCRANTFNSTLNGQLELRWRFVNAFKASVMKGSARVSERDVMMPPELGQTDRFYWRYGLSAPSRWRELDMSADLSCLGSMLTHVSIEKFFLLATTAESQRPDADLARIRLYDGAAARVDAHSNVFWMSLSALQSTLALATYP